MRGANHGKSGLPWGHGSLPDGSIPAGRLTDQTGNFTADASVAQTQAATQLAPPSVPAFRSAGAAHLPQHLAQQGSPSQAAVHDQPQAGPVSTRQGNVSEQHHAMQQVSNSSGAGQLSSEPGPMQRLAGSQASGHGVYNTIQHASPSPRGSTQVYSVYGGDASRERQSLHTANHSRGVQAFDVEAFKSQQASMSPRGLRQEPSSTRDGNPEYGRQENGQDDCMPAQTGTGCKGYAMQEASHSSQGSGRVGSLADNQALSHLAQEMSMSPRGSPQGDAVKEVAAGRQRYARGQRSTREYGGPGHGSMAAALMYVKPPWAIDDPYQVCQVNLGTCLP